MDLEYLRLVNDVNVSSRGLGILALKIDLATVNWWSGRDRILSATSLVGELEGGTLMVDLWSVGQQNEQAPATAKVSTATVKLVLILRWRKSHKERVCRTYMECLWCLWRSWYFWCYERERLYGAVVWRIANPLHGEILPAIYRESEIE